MAGSGKTTPRSALSCDYLISWRSPTEPVGSPHDEPVESSLRIDDLPGAVIAYDAAGVVVQANLAAYELLGIEPKMLVGSKAQDAGWLLTDASGWPDPVGCWDASAARSSAPPAGSDR